VQNGILGIAVYFWKFIAGHITTSKSQHFSARLDFDGTSIPKSTDIPEQETM
jgi:hypothetical protein